MTAPNKPLFGVKPGGEDVCFLLDLSGWVHRAWHALKPRGDHLRPAPNGEPSGVTAMVVGWLVDLLRDQQPAYLGVGLDTHGPTWRHALYPEFKAGRPTPEPAMLAQERRCIEILRAHQIPCFVAEGFDADDAIATATVRARACGLSVVIVSSDKDLLTLTADPGVIVWDHKTGDVIYGEDVPKKKRFGGVGAGQLPDLLALMGDTADNIPGVKGIGSKTAGELLQRFGDLDGVLARVPSEHKPGKVRDAVVRDATLAILSRRLVELRLDAPIGFEVTTLRTGWNEADAERLRDLYRALGIGWAAAGVVAMPKKPILAHVLTAWQKRETPVPRRVAYDPREAAPVPPAPAVHVDRLLEAPSLPPKEAPRPSPVQTRLPGL